MCLVVEKDREIEIDCVLLSEDGWNLSVFLERSLSEDERNDMLYVSVVGGDVRVGRER